jgi:hypothetical protein
MSFWTLYLDVSGRIAETDPDTEFITVAGVILEKDRCGALRSFADQKHKKWKDTNYHSATGILNLLLNDSVCFVVYQLQRTQPAWSVFWSEGKMFYEKLVSEAKLQRIRGRKKDLMPFMQPGIVMRYYLLSECSSLLLGLSLREGKLSNVVDANRLHPLVLEIVADSDIQGDLNKRQFEKIWRDWGATSRLRDILHVRPQIDSVRIETEEQDPLLLLPDYLAGISHYKASVQSVEPPTDLPTSQIDALFDRLKQAGGNRMQQCYFDKKYPTIQRMIESSVSARNKSAKVLARSRNV